MRNLYVIMGKSASGKDTLAKKLQERGLHREPTYTTRPIRPGETRGVEYHFVSEEDFWNGVENGSFLETREYETEYGTWYYGSTLDTYRKSDFVILTPEGLEAVRGDLEANGIHPMTVYLDVPERIRIRRSIERDGIGKLDEIFRRAEADEKDFAGFRADITLDGSAEGLEAFVDMLTKAPAVSDEPDEAHLTGLEFLIRCVNYDGLEEDLSRLSVKFSIGGSIGGSMPRNVTVCKDGEEENGSEALIRVMASDFEVSLTAEDLGNAVFNRFEINSNSGEQPVILDVNDFFVIYSDGDWGKLRYECDLVQSAKKCLGLPYIHPLD